MKNIFWCGVMTVLMVVGTGCYRTSVQTTEEIDPALLGDWTGPSLLTIGDSPPETLTVTFTKQDSTTYKIKTSKGLEGIAQVANIGGLKFLCLKFHADFITKDYAWNVGAYKIVKADIKRGRLRDQCIFNPLNDQAIPAARLKTPQALRAAIEAKLGNRNLFSTWQGTYKKN